MASVKILFEGNFEGRAAATPEGNHRLEKPFPQPEAENESMEFSEILVGGIEIIGKIFTEWTALCEEGASNQPFFRPEWFAAFVKNFENKFMLLTVRRGGRLRAVLPLTKKNGKLHGIPARKLEAIFNANTQRFDLIHEPDESRRKETVEAVWKEIKKQRNWDVLEMRLVQKDSWLKDLLALAESENYRTGIWQMDSAPFIELPQATGDKEKLIEEYFKGSRKHLQRELNRRLRRLQELGKVEFVVTRDYRAELMRKYFELEAGGWKGRAGTAASADEKVVRLHEDFARAAAERNALFIYELKLDDKTIAMQICLMYDGSDGGDGRRTVQWKIAYDEQYARYSPGNLLFREVLKGCLENDSMELDMLCPATENKKFWATGEREHVAFYIFRRGLVGSLLWNWKFSVISRLRKFKKKTPSKTAVAASSS